MRPARIFPTSAKIFPLYCILGCLKRLHDTTCNELPRAKNALEKGWMHPDHYAEIVRDHHLRVFEETERLLSAVHFYLERTGA